MSLYISLDVERSGAIIARHLTVQALQIVVVTVSSTCDACCVLDR